MKPAEKLTTLLDCLQCDVRTINGNPLIPNSVKQAVDTTLRILETLVEMANDGRPA